MIIASVMYPGGEGKTFNMDYYLNVHCPLVQEVFGDVLKGLWIEKGISGPLPGSEPPYAVIGRLGFDSTEAFMAVMMRNAAKIMQDIPNFTNVSPVIQISDVVR